MDLTEDQKAAIADWVSEGASLADVQRLLRETFSISMTYMDVRFLVDDLDLTFAEPEAEEKAAEAGTTDPAADLHGAKAEPVDGAAANEAEEPELVDAGGTGSVQVEVDAVMRPGALVSGTVRFSDGKSLGWQLTSAGQLGLIPGDDPDYRPSAEDVEAFQGELEKVLREKGM